MKKFLGIEYGRGACKNPTDGGPALAPALVKNMFPTADWTMVKSAPCDINACRADRFGDTLQIHKKIYSATPDAPHVLIGGDHSINFGHFATLADRMPTQDLCLIYIDAHLDIHTPESSRAEASGAPHGTNVRALLGDGDARWLALQKRCPALRPENIFYLASRSYEPSEIKFATENNIFMRRANTLQTMTDAQNALNDIRAKIGNRPYVVSFDFDAIDPKYFPDVLVPEPGGISVEVAEYFIGALAPRAHSFEFVEYAPRRDTQSADIVHKLIEIVVNQ